MKRKFFIITMMVACLSFNQAFAAEDLSQELQDCPKEFQEQVVNDANAAMADAKLRNAEMNQAMNAIDKQAQQKISSCWGALKNMGLTGAAGLPNLAQIVANIVNGIDSACAGAVSGVTSGINSQVSQMTGGMKFPGIPGIPGTNITPSIYVGSTGQGGFNFMSQSTQAYNNYMNPQTPAATSGTSTGGGQTVQTSGGSPASQVFQTTSQPTSPWYSKALNSIKNAF